MVALLLGTCALAYGQNIAIDGGSHAASPSAVAGEFSGDAAPAFDRSLCVPGDYQVPAMRAQSRLPEAPPVFVSQDALTLEASATSSRRSVESVVDLDVLREPSPFRKIAVSGSAGTTQGFASHLQSSLALISAAYRPQGEQVDTADCEAVGLSVEQRIKLDPSLVLEVVESEVSANPGCACELVKAAIRTSEAGPELVADIVEVAIMASPESMRMISQCAIAVVPESLAAVQAVLAKLDPNSGDLRPGAKSGAKGAKVVLEKAVIEVAQQLPDPLDLPPPVPPIPPPPHFPPPVTVVDR